MQLLLCVLLSLHTSLFYTTDAVLTLTRQSAKNSLLNHKPFRQQSWYNDEVDDPYTIESDHLPPNVDYFPTISNGYIGHVMFSDHLFMNGLFNGKQGHSHKAKVPIKTPKIMSLAPNASNFYTVDLFLNLFEEVTFDPNGNIYTLLAFAHSIYSRLLVFQLSACCDFDGTHTVLLDSSQLLFDSFDDLNIVNSTNLKFNISSSCDDCKYLSTATAYHGRTKEAEEDFSLVQDVTVIATVIPDMISVTDNYPGYYFLISVAPTFDEAYKFYEAGIESAEAGNLSGSHSINWLPYVDNSIGVKGDPVLNKAISSCMFYLLNSFPPPNMESNYPFDFLGVGPGGVAHGAAGKDYQGHVFWDQDFWMVPGLLPLFPGKCL